VELGFKTPKADMSLFYLNTCKLVMYILVYVNGIILISSKPDATVELLNKLKDEFALKDLEDLHYFLGIEVSKINDGIILTQEKYVNDFLRRAGMTQCKPCATPMSTNEKLSIGKGTNLGPKEATHYRSIVGALQYLSLTRPDISFAVNKVCQYLHAPTEHHWVAVKRIIRYLKSSVKLGLKITKTNSFLVSAFSDVDSAGCLHDRCSTGGFAIFFDSNLISWSARK
jgi:hypothetical protein